MDLIEEMVISNKGISKIILHGSTTRLLQFNEGIKKIQNKHEIQEIIPCEKVPDSVNGYILAKKLDITMFDLAEFNYVITGE